ncbi:hypothetical protein GUJ93_ZPchr0010g8050 [Zizania palustris]|uniref:Uncharacterized protein n=1 Tax=Zizania palustris TaxID=103762 RepID=A0A8J6BR14_ZIZPA|nr:hypothetical protein GUJ93_ZPchr0010g8050 [Zizania palustris]
MRRHNSGKIYGKTTLSRDSQRRKATNVKKKGGYVSDVAPEGPRQHTITSASVEVEDAHLLNVTNDIDHRELVLDNELVAFPEEVAPNVAANSDDVNLSSPVPVGLHEDSLERRHVGWNPPCVDGPLLVFLTSDPQPH